MPDPSDQHGGLRQSGIKLPGYLMNGAVINGSGSFDWLRVPRHDVQKHGVSNGYVVLGK